MMTFSLERKHFLAFFKHYRWLVLGLFLLTPKVDAQQAQVSVNTSGLNLAINQSALSVIALAIGQPNVFNNLDTEIAQSANQLALKTEQTLQNLQTGDFLSSLAEATNAVGQSSGMSYATGARWFSLGAGLGVGIKPSLLNQVTQGLHIDLHQTSIPPYGVAFNLPLKLALYATDLPFLPKIPLIDLSRFSLHLSWSGFGVSGIGQEQVALNVSAFSVQLNYQLIGKLHLDPLGLVQWGGLHINSGYAYNDQTLTLTSTIPTQATPLSNSSLNMTLLWSGQTKLVIDAQVNRWPLEVSTDIKLLHFLTLYTVFGLDLSSAKVSISANSEVPLQLVVNNIPFVSNNYNLLQSNAKGSVQYNVSSSPFLARLHGLFGFQLNCFVVSLYAHITGDSSGLMGLQSGLYFYW